MLHVVGNVLQTLRIVSPEVYYKVVCFWCSCKFCAFCTQCSISLGVLICIECSGVHRSLGVAISKVCKASKLYLFPSGTYVCYVQYVYYSTHMYIHSVCTPHCNLRKHLKRKYCTYVCHITSRKDPFLTYVLFTSQMLYK